MVPVLDPTSHQSDTRRGWEPKVVKVVRCPCRWDDTFINTWDFRMMKVNSEDWREQESVKALCDGIRSSLHDVAAAVPDEQAGAQAWEDESSTASISPRLVFPCGSARYKDNQRCWILRSSRDSSSKKPRSSVGRRKNGCDPVLAGTSIVDTSEQMAPYHNTSIARVQYSEPHGNSSPTCPPVHLIQRIFRTTELRWAFEHLESVIAGSSIPGTRNTSVVFKRETIDFEPMISYLLENCNRYFGAHGRKQVTQDAIAYCSAVISDDASWTTVVYDSDGTQTSTKRNARVPRILRNLLEYCLEECPPDTSTTKNVSGTSGPASSTHLDSTHSTNTTKTSMSSARMRGESPKRHERNGVVKGKAETANDVRRSKRRKLSPWNENAMAPLPPETSEHFENNDSKKNGFTVTNASGRAPRRCMRCVEFNGGGAHECRGRGGARHCEHFTLNGAPIRPSLQLAFPQQATRVTGNQVQNPALSVCAKFVNNSEAPGRKNACLLGVADDRSRSFKYPKNLENSGWTKLSHLGHVSDYHGVQRQYESFFPLTLKSSAKEMVKDIERTLEEHHFDETHESDEDVTEESIAYERALSSYAASAKKEKTSIRTRHSQGRTVVHKFIDEDLPIFFDGEEQVGMESKCPSDHSCVICDGQAEITGGGTTPLLHSFREVETGPLDFQNDQGRIEGIGRPSRRREIIMQRKASLSILYHLHHSLKFISAYNLDGEDGSHEKTNECVGSCQSSALRLLRVPGKSNKGRLSGEKERDRAEATQVNRLVVVYDLPSLSLNHLKNECIQYSKRQENVPMVAISRKPSTKSLRDFLNAVADYRPEATSEDDLVEQRNYQRAIRSYSGKADQERIEKLRHDEEREHGMLHKFRARKPSPEDLERKDLETRSVLFITMRAWDATCLFGRFCSTCSVTEKSVTTKSPACTPVLHPSVRRVDEDILSRGEEMLVENKDSRSKRSRDKASLRGVEMEGLGHLHRRLDFVEQYNNGWIFSSSRRRK